MGKSLLQMSIVFLLFRNIKQAASQAGSPSQFKSNSPNKPSFGVSGGGIKGSPEAVEAAKRAILKGYYVPDDLEIVLKEPNPTHFCSPYDPKKITIRETKILGQGGFGKVSLANISKMGSQTLRGGTFALKRTHFTVANAKLMLKELNFLRLFGAVKLERRRVMALIDCFYQDMPQGAVDLLIVMELMDSDMEKQMKKNFLDPRNRFNDFPHKITALYNATTALNQVHSQNIIHRDVKLDNFFLKGFSPVVGDLGLADFDEPSNESIKQSLSSRCGTPLYMAPEVGTTVATKKSDVYSLCITFIAYLTNRLPNQFIDYDEKTYKGPVYLSFVKQVYPQFIGLLQKMCAENPEDRPTLEEVAGELMNIGRGKGTFAASNVEDVPSHVMTKFNERRQKMKMELTLKENKAVYGLIQNQQQANAFRRYNILI